MEAAAPDAEPRSALAAESVTGASEPSPRRKRPRRKKAPRAADGAHTDAGDTPGGPKAKRANPPSQTVFVGQLAFTTTEDQLRAHFAAVPGMSGPPVRVRLLSHKATGEPRGMAFVQLAGEADVHTALKSLHKSVLGGRRLNVERTVGGGGTSTARLDKIKKLRTIQDASIHRRVQSLVDAVVAEFGGDDDVDDADAPAETQETMGLRASDVDERAREFLSTVSEDLARDALRDFAESAARRVDNRPAFLMGVLKRFVEERAAEDAKAKEKARGKGKGTAGGSGGRGGGGRGGSGRGVGGRSGGGRGGERGGRDGAAADARGKRRRGSEF